MVASKIPQNLIPKSHLRIIGRDTYNLEHKEKETIENKQILSGIFIVIYLSI